MIIQDFLNLVYDTKSVIVNHFLKLTIGIWSHHFMEIDGETVETASDFILGGSKITADGDCSHEIKRRLLLGEML